LIRIACAMPNRRRGHPKKAPRKAAQRDAAAKTPDLEREPLCRA
jgi:hypothetical protein